MSAGKAPKIDLGLNLRWFDSIIFDKSVLCRSDGSNFVEHDDENVKASYEYVALNSTALDGVTEREVEGSTNFDNDENSFETMDM